MTSEEASGTSKTGKDLYNNEKNIKKYAEKATPAIKKYNLRQKSINFPNSNFVHDHGLFVGLKHKILNDKDVLKFADIFFKSFK